MTPGSRRAEHGMATWLGLAALVVPGTAAAVGVGVTQVVTARHQAAAAADLGALAGATALGRGGDACAAAAGVVRRNGGLLVSCRPSGDDVLVTASVTTAALMGLRWRPEASARAGPGPR